MNEQPQPKLSHMWRLYIMLLVSTLVFACGVPMVTSALLGLKANYEFVVLLCVTTTSVLIANILLFTLIRCRARSMLNGFIERTNPYIDLPQEVQHAKPSMEVDSIEHVFNKVLSKLHDSVKEQLQTEREGMLASIAALIAALESRDRYTQNHSARVAALSGKIACEMGLSKRDINDIKLAALLHDVGKIGIRDAVLLKEGKLTDEEYEIIKTHPKISGEILRPIKGLKSVIAMIVHHHERPDGRGYPDGLKEDEVPIGACIIAAADAYDAMTINRSYRKALTPDKVVSELILCRGTQFHTGCVDALITALEKENRLGKAVALNGDAWTEQERQHAKDGGHVWDDVSLCGNDSDNEDICPEVRIAALENLAQVLKSASPEPIIPDPNPADTQTPPSPLAPNPITR